MCSIYLQILEPCNVFTLDCSFELLHTHKLSIVTLQKKVIHSPEVFQVKSVPACEADLWSIQPQLWKLHVRKFAIP